MDPEVSIILPVYKNRDTIKELHRQLSDVLAGRTLEFVFVDDACPENSLGELRKLASEDKCLAVVAFSENQGQQRAVLAGLQHARGEIVVVMDADLQDPPDAVPRLLDKLAEGYDVVFAGRAGKYQVGHRLLTSRLYKWTLHILLGVPVDAGLFMVLKREHIQALLALPTDNPHLVAMFGALQLKNTSIPVERDVRPVGVSAYTSWMRLKVGLGAAFWAFRWKIGLQGEFSGRERTYPVKEYIQSKY